MNYALRADRSYLLRKAALKNRRSSDSGLMGLGDDDDCGFLFGPEIQGPSTMKQPHCYSSQQSSSEQEANNHVTQRRICKGSHSNGGISGYGSHGNGLNGDSSGSRTNLLLVSTLRCLKNEQG